MKLDEILTNKYLRFLIPLLVAIPIMFYFKGTLNIPIQNRLQCREEKKVLTETITGIVISNFRDFENKRLRTLIYRNGRDTVRSTIFFYEVTDFFSYLEPGDTVRKKSGSLVLSVKGIKKDSVYVLNYGCIK